MANSIDNPNSRRSSTSSEVSSNQQNTQSNAVDAKWQDKNIKPVSTTPSVIADADDPTAIANTTPIKQENHSSFITWLDNIQTQNKKSFNKDLDSLSTNKMKKLKTLKKSDLSKEVDIPLEASIDSTPKIKKISRILLAITNVMLITAISLLGSAASIYAVIPVVVILFASITLLILIGVTKNSSDHTKIINLDQKSVRVGITNMLHAIFKEMDIDKDYSMEYETLKNKIEQIIENGTAFQQFNKLNNNIKTVSNYDDAQLLNELTKDREQLKIQKQIRIILSSLFAEIETEIQDEEFRNSFLRAKQKYFTSLAEKGFENTEDLEFSYLLLHNLCKKRQLDYHRNDINPIVQAGIKDGMKIYTQTLTSNN
jgi:hypothetical protein